MTQKRDINSLDTTVNAKKSLSPTTAGSLKTQMTEVILDMTPLCKEKQDQSDRVKLDRLTKFIQVERRF